MLSALGTNGILLSFPILPSFFFYPSPLPFSGFQLARYKAKFLCNQCDCAVHSCVVTSEMGRVYLLCVVTVDKANAFC